MPIIYLSPSTQRGGRSVTGSGSEEFNMNLLADAMVPYLLSNGIQYRRNTPEMTAAASIRQANAGNYDFFLALHANSSGVRNSGNQRGISVYYYPGSREGERAADLFARNLREIYPVPALVRTEAVMAPGEVREPKFPAVLIRMGYQDNYSDAVWMETHRDAIAQELVRSLTEFFGLPFIYPMPPAEGRVKLDSGTLNLRSYPSPTGAVLINMPAGAPVTVYGEWQGWYVVHYGPFVGYAAAVYIEI